jgi:hypothetical protein
MTLRDHIYIQKTGYTHHGINCGDGTVIHFDSRKICKISMNDFCGGRNYFIKEYVKCDSKEVVYQRAKSRLGDCNYNLIYNNCEHFACYCKTGFHKSKQVVKFINKLLPHTKIIYKELNEISSKLDRIEFKLDLAKETKLLGLIQGLIDAIDISNSNLIYQYIDGFYESYQYNLGYLKSLAKNKLNHEDLPFVTELFVKYTNLTIISNFALSICYFCLCHKDKAIEVLQRFSINNELFSGVLVYEKPWYCQPSNASYIFHPALGLSQNCYSNSSSFIIPSIYHLLFGSNTKKEKVVEFKLDESSSSKIINTFSQFEDLSEFYIKTDPNKFLSRI